MKTTSLYIHSETLQLSIICYYYKKLFKFKVGPITFEHPVLFFCQLSKNHTFLQVEDGPMVLFKKIARSSEVPYELIKNSLLT